MGGKKSWTGFVSDSRPVTTNALSSATWILDNQSESTNIGRKALSTDQPRCLPGKPFASPDHRRLVNTTGDARSVGETRDHRWRCISLLDAPEYLPLVNHEDGSLSLVRVSRSPHWERIWAATCRGLQPPGVGPRACRVAHSSGLHRQRSVWTNGLPGAPPPLLVVPRRAQVP